jgi:hypothetical protein
MPSPESRRNAMTSGRILLLGVAGVLLLSVAPARAGDKPAAGISVDKKNKTVIVPCLVAPRKLPNLKEIYPIEVVACYPAPKGQKAHETVVTFTVKPSDVHKALVDLGLKPGKPVMGGAGAGTGPEVEIFLEVPDGDGKTRKIPIEESMVLIKTGKTMPKQKWRFTGSALKQPDPEKDDKEYGADLTGTLITIIPVTDDTVIQTALTLKDEAGMKLETNKRILPKEGTPIKLLIKVK